MLRYRNVLRLDQREPPSEAALARAQSLGFDAAALARGDPSSVRRVKARGLEVLLDLPAGDLEPWLDAGVGGFCCTAAHETPPETWKRLIEEVRGRYPETLFLAFTFGASPRAVAGLAGCRFDAAASSSCWWDFRAGWIDDDAARVEALGEVIALAEPPSGPRPPTVRERRRALWLAAHYAPIWMMTLGFEAELEAEVELLNARRREQAGLFAGPPARLVSAPGAEIAVLARGSMAVPGLVLALNSSAHEAAVIEAEAVLPSIGGAGGTLAPLDAGAHASARIAAGESFRLGPAEADAFRFVPAAPIRRRSLRGRAERAATRPRIAIEAVRPAVDDGRFPAKRIAGETARIEVDLINDGHGVVAADLLWQPSEAAGWERTPMAALGNDRYAASFPLARIGRYLFTVEAWHDPFASLLVDMAKKAAAGVPVRLEIEEAMALIAAAGKADEALGALVSALEAGGEAERARLITKPETAALMRAGAVRPFLTRREPPLPLEAERPAAGFASWYELFPRSQSGDAARHGTFADVIARLPAIRAMGFDVLYFPPIHPIGKVHRKGRNNALGALPEDPGSPYAIGSEEGGHDAIHPGLGTLEDFRHLGEVAAEQGMEIALDFAIQCAPDHPWVREHPEWFEWRPDGSIRYAENPPKRYEDIVNVAFYGPGAVPALWEALRDVVRFWIGQGVRTFRVDNPHTKPLPFWEWLIEDIRAHDPDVIFLAEAFTRPTMMYRLAKIGFSQSYTYFTWRETKYELMAYFTELSAAPVGDFLRPNLFVNTPDINPFFLQTGGRPAFLIRAALAATLSGLWGMYNGFELCEARALPGREEYLDSEKYEIRAWDWDRPGNITAEISRLNQIRRTNPALHSHRNVEFLNAFDDAVLYYARSSPDGRNALLVAVNLDPGRAVETDLEIPLWRFGLPDEATMGAEELMRGRSVVWHGKRQRVRLDPADLPFAIWRLDNPAGRPYGRTP
ncbi:MAG: maltotransferase domain-containing protein [Acetobacteraceae bacterium]